MKWNNGMVEYWNSAADRPHASVAQISNLLYRRIPFCERFENSARCEKSSALPIGNRRYSRLEICATSIRALIITGQLV